MDSLANEFDRFEKGMSGDQDENASKSIATYVLAFMARGLFSKYEYVVAYYPGQGCTAEQIYPMMWEVIHTLETYNFNVRCIVSDGFSANQKLYRLHPMPDDSNLTPEGHIHWTWNYANPGVKIFFICDVPHLLKTIRNNLENSHWNSCTRNLMVSYIDRKITPLPQGKKHGRNKFFR